MTTLLLVEDDPNQLDLYRQELADEGYDVITARNGGEALSSLDRFTPDAVIMDISMPGMDGIDAMSRMLCKNHQLPIILNTAYPSYKDNFRVWSADACVLKSSDMTDLKATIQQVLSERQSGTSAEAPA